MFLASLCEQNYINATFNELKDSFVVIYNKIESDTAVKEDENETLWFYENDKEELKDEIELNINTAKKQISECEYIW